MTRTDTAPVRGWDEGDVRGIELRAVSAHFGVETARLEVLLSPLFALNCARPQIQPLLEQAWVRLQALREELVDLHTSLDGNAVAAVQRAEQALRDSQADGLQLAAAALADAAEAERSTAGKSHSQPRLLVAQGQLAAISFNFATAATYCIQAAERAGDDVEARWRFCVLHAEFMLDHGRELNDANALQTLVSYCDDVLWPLAKSRASVDQAWVKDCLGQALGLIGRGQSATAPLSDAIDAFSEALALRNREQDPYAWAATQNHLGNAIGSLGQRQHELELLDLSASAFEAALEIPISNAAPESRASALNNLAAVLQTIGPLRGDADTVERAVDAYRSALTIWTPERKPLFWAATQCNLGAALRVLGSMREDATCLEQSADAYRAALSARSRERMPAEWARTQNDLGATLQALGEQTEDTLAFGRAIAAFRESLKEADREAAPMTWALTMANLGVARRKLAEYQLDVDVSRRAIADIRGALDVFRGASHARLTELGLEQLAIAMEVNAELEAPATD